MIAGWPTGGEERPVVAVFDPTWEYYAVLTVSPGSYMRQLVRLLDEAYGFLPPGTRFELYLEPQEFGRAMYLGWQYNPNMAQQEPWEVAMDLPTSLMEAMRRREEADSTFARLLS